VLIFANRKIWRALPEELKIDYIRDNMNDLIEEENLEEADIKNISDMINNIIRRNEKAIDTFGIEKYYNMDYPAEFHECGFRHSTGIYAVGVFDWSMESFTDTSWNYSFNIYKVL